MKKITCTMVGLFIVFLSMKAETSPQHIKEGAPLHVVASSGLNMRSKPNHSSLSIKTIPYASTVIVLAQNFECLLSDEIEWVSGQWIKVEHKGDQGYIFNGFLSSLTPPDIRQNSGEQEISLIVGLDIWIYNNLKPVSIPDTMSNEFSYTIKHHFENRAIYEQQLYSAGYRSRLFLQNVRIMDVFHLIKGFYDDNFKKEKIDSKSIFIKDKNNKLESIKLTVKPT